MKLCTFIHSLEELNAYLGKFPFGTPGKETKRFPIGESINIIYQSMVSIIQILLSKKCLISLKEE